MPDLTVCCFLCHFVISITSLCICDFRLFAAHFPWDFICGNSFRSELSLTSSRKELVFSLADGLGELPRMALISHDVPRNLTCHL